MKSGLALQLCFIACFFFSRLEAVFIFFEAVFAHVWNACRHRRPLPKRPHRLAISHVPRAEEPAPVFRHS